MNAQLTLGPWSTSGMMPFEKVMWAIPGGAATQPDGQVAAIDTDVLKDWAVRISTRDREIYFSDTAHACSEPQLQTSGYTKLDTAGYYQRDGAFEKVSPTYSAPLVPTFNARVFNEVVPVQLTTGYQGREAQLKINSPLYEKIKGKLGPSSGERSIDGKKYSAFGPFREFQIVDSQSNAVGFDESVVVLLMLEKESIGEWTVPAAQISVRAFVDIVDDYELRADQKGLWVHPRKTYINSSSICGSDD